MEVKEHIPESIRAEILLEALPYIQKFHQKIIVIKYGGAAMKDPQLRDSFARDVVLLKFVGIHPVIVHGGGPKINELLQKLNLPIEFVDGQRVTSDEVMEIVEMVLSGYINKEIVSLIQKHGGKSIGISGRDANLAVARITKIYKQIDGTMREISLGRVGSIEKVDPKILLDLIFNGYIPVIAPVSPDEEGKSLNINADFMASAIASSLKAEKLILLTDTPGVMHQQQVLNRLHPHQIHELIQKQVITGGMIPKVQCCLDALEKGVRRAHIIDGRILHSLLLELFSYQGIGTMISYDADEEL
ncbi:MAG: acetylglutamate kinase [Leptospiraceae bacterium]|nr:acetylglutamate kinase [Leptospiraceae bacterium]MDW7976638.1 acetylglutamate kinase [Leptospiraceae bacterium]